jgi:hypothetical protein
MQFVIVTLLLRSQQVSAVHDHPQLSTTNAQTAALRECHNFVLQLKIKIKISQPLLILVKTS